MLKVRQGRFIVAEAAACNASVMISVGKDRIDPDRPVKIILCASYITEIILGYASEKIIPVISRVQTGKHVEIFDRLGISSLGKCLTSPHEEDILVVLCIKPLQSGCKKQDGNSQEFQHFMHNYFRLWVFFTIFGVRFSKPNDKYTHLLRPCRQKTEKKQQSQP